MAKRHIIDISTPGLMALALACDIASEHAEELQMEPSETEALREQLHSMRDWLNAVITTPADGKATLWQIGDDGKPVATDLDDIPEGEKH